MLFKQNIFCILIKILDVDEKFLFLDLSGMYNKFVL